MVDQQLLYQLSRQPQERGVSDPFRLDQRLEEP